ncbi:MAG: hypothetical protein J6Q13_00530 [Clostridia bacterium]|nr:hypothetical protein [Clostridia bacterium]
MTKTWEQETAEMLKKINDETEKLLHSDISEEEFHKKHQELIDYWNETSKKIQQNHPFKRKPKAHPKHNHQSHHMTEKYMLKKILRNIK